MRARILFRLVGIPSLLTAVNTIPAPIVDEAAPSKMRPYLASLTSDLILDSRSPAAEKLVTMCGDKDMGKCQSIIGDLNRCYNLDETFLNDNVSSIHASNTGSTLCTFWDLVGCNDTGKTIVIHADYITDLKTVGMGDRISSLKCTALDRADSDSLTPAGPSRDANHGAEIPGDVNYPLVHLCTGAYYAGNCRWVWGKFDQCIKLNASLDRRVSSGWIENESYSCMFYRGYRCDEGHFSPTDPSFPDLQDTGFDNTIGSFKCIRRARPKDKDPSFSESTGQSAWPSVVVPSLGKQAWQANSDKMWLAGVCTDAMMNGNCVDLFGTAGICIGFGNGSVPHLDNQISSFRTNPQLECHFFDSWDCTGYDFYIHPGHYTFNLAWWDFNDRISSFLCDFPSHKNPEDHVSLELRGASRIPTADGRRELVQNQDHHRHSALNTTIRHKQIPIVAWQFTGCTDMNLYGDCHRFIMVNGVCCSLAGTLWYNAIDSLKTADDYQCNFYDDMRCRDDAIGVPHGTVIWALQPHHWENRIGSFWCIEVNNRGMAGTNMTISRAAKPDELCYHTNNTCVPFN